MLCIVVKRGDFQQFDRLYKAFGDKVPILWDRRRERKAADEGGPQAQTEERRHTPPLSWTKLGFVVVDRPS